MTYPNPDFELELLLGADYLIGMDEVGRGAIAGPVAVGAAMVSSSRLRSWPIGVRDSKLLSETAREAIFPKVLAWTRIEVGIASVQEIETSGITRALALAATRALDRLSQEFSPSDRVVVLLDGNHNWLADSTDLAVVTRKKADQDCVAVAAASVVAKVSRDSMMRDLSLLHPGYSLESNKGYASDSHIRALQLVGPSSAHRLSWLGKILGDGQLF